MKICWQTLLVPIGHLWLRMWPTTLEQIPENALSSKQQLRAPYQMRPMMCVRKNRQDRGFNHHRRHHPSRQIPVPEILHRKWRTNMSKWICLSWANGWSLVAFKRPSTATRASQIWHHCSKYSVSWLSNTSHFTYAPFIHDSIAHVIGIRDGKTRGEKVIVLRTASQKCVQTAVYYLIGSARLNVKTGEFPHAQHQI